MDDQSISAVTAEMEPLLLGRAPGKMFQLGPLSLVIDFRLRDQTYLFISTEPALPRIHLVKRRVRDLEKQSTQISPFALALRKDLSNTTVRSVRKDAGDRVVRFHFTGTDELGSSRDFTLLVQLSGRSANMFLLDRAGVIVHRVRTTRNPGQQAGDIYERPSAQPSAKNDRQAPKSDSELLETIRNGRFPTASEAVDDHFTSLLSKQAFDSTAAAARAELRTKLSQQKKLLQQLQKDLATHANPEQHKRLGDLLLANLSTAKRAGKRVVLIDYFADDGASIEVEIDEKSTLQEEAAHRFQLYSRSKRAVKQISSRIETVVTEVARLEARLTQLEEIIAERNEAALEKFTAKRSVQSSSPGGSRSVPPAGRSGQKPEKKIPGTRRYLSSDGFEILVGRTARDNDHLTFKVAKPNDLWLHAADYGGSHVVVRNSTRKDLPHRTIIEAAQLAAHFSQTRKDPKVDVHYAQRKFVSKPKGSAPGLVRLTRFKSITVEPKEAIERI
jgi:predicted ribosome quality control (RQC) complex YloA/Tae2 family protein